MPNSSPVAIPTTTIFGVAMLDAFRVTGCELAINAGWDEQEMYENDRAMYYTFNRAM